MKRSLMVFAAISAFALPALAPVATLAQDRGGRGIDDRARAPQRDNQQGNRQRTAPDGGAQADRGGRGNGGERPNWTPPTEGRGGGDRPGPRPDRPEPDQPRPQPQPDRPNGGGSGDQNRPGQGRPDQGRPDQGRPDQGRPDQGRPGQGRPDQGRPDQGRPDQGRPGQGRPDQGRPGNGNGSWNGGNNWRPGDQRPGAGSRPNRPGNNWNNGGNYDRDRQRNDFRNRFDSNRWQQDWNRNHRSDWWRNDRRFSGWSGARIGFYFAPGYGYYSVPRTYYGRQYYAGDYLPSIFWRYSVNDYRTYGLGYPPEGTRWVYVDNSIYLIDQYDGYIIDVIRNAWRW